MEIPPDFSLFDSEITTLIPRQNKKRLCDNILCLNGTIGSLLTLVVLCCAVVISLTALVHTKIQELNPEGLLIVSPWQSSSKNPNTPRLRPCIVSSLSCEGPQPRHRCPDGHTYCPSNYTCTNMAPNRAVCLASEFRCPSEFFFRCHDFFKNMQKMVEEEDCGDRIVFVELSSSGFIVSLIIQSASILYTIILTVVVLLPCSHKNPMPLKSNPVLYTVTGASLLGLGLVVSPGIIIIATSSPSILETAELLHADCFEEEPTWLWTHNSMLLGVVVGGSLGGLAMVVLGTALLSHVVPEVLSGFWNAKSFVQIAVWSILLFGVVTIILLST